MHKTGKPLKDYDQLGLSICYVITIYYDGSFIM